MINQILIIQKMKTQNELYADLLENGCRSLSTIFLFLFSMFFQFLYTSVYTSMLFAFSSFSLNLELLELFLKR